MEILAASPFNYPAALLQVACQCCGMLKFSMAMRLPQQGIAAIPRVRHCAAGASAELPPFAAILLQ